VTTPEERIRELAKQSAIDPAEAERLLAAVRPPALAPPRSKNPFERWSGERASLVGLAVSALAFGISLLGVRFDGVLDLHAAKDVSFRTVLLDQILAFPVAALVFWLVARVAARHVRLVDVVGTVGLARGPGVLMAIPVALLDGNSGGHGRFTVSVMAAAFVARIGSGVQVYLLVVGFRTATGLRGARLTISFVTALFLAEVIAKISDFVMH
jgi:hypothetical protein